MYKILLVDDEKLEIEVLKMIIHELQDSLEIVGIAYNGEKALELDEKLDPDIVIIDNEIPCMKGIEVSKIIKKNNKEKSVVLMMEHYNNNMKTNYPVNHRIIKPIHKNNLIEILKEEIRTLKIHTSKIKEKEMLLLDRIIFNEEKDVKILLKDILEGYYLSCDKNIDILKEKTEKLLERIIRILNKLKYENKEKINREVYLKKLYVSKNFNSIYSLMESVFDIIIKKREDNNIREILIGDKKVSESIENAIKYIEDNYNKKIILENVANSCNLSVYYLSSLFKKNTGMKLIDYVNLYKIEKAKEMIKVTDLSLLSIALDLGYDETGYFSRVFKNIVGIPPSQYRSDVKSKK